MKETSQVVVLITTATEEEAHRIAERRIFPAVNIERSGTRREELLLDEETLKQVWLLRRMASMISSDSANFAEATERILDRLSKTKTNAEFLATLNREA